MEDRVACATTTHTISKQVFSAAPSFAERQPGFSPVGSALRKLSRAPCRVLLQTASSGEKLRGALQEGAVDVNRPAFCMSRLRAFNDVTHARFDSTNNYRRMLLCSAINRIDPCRLAQLPGSSAHVSFY